MKIQVLLVQATRFITENPTFLLKLHL